MAQAPKPRTRRTPKSLESFNPRTGRVIGKVTANAPAEVAGIVGTARKVAPEWAAIDPRGRGLMLKEVRRRIYDSMDDIIETISTECGKPMAEALAHDVLPSVITLMYYERSAHRLLRTERAGGILAPMIGVSSRIQWRPYGVVGCITPWNYPLFMSFMAITPALAAGNTVVIKPSEVTPGVGERLRSILDPLPPGVATVIQGAGDVGAALVNAPCDKICFIGSTPTARKIAGAAAKHLTPLVMELGGKDAAIVCSDADLDVASSGVLWGSFFNAGQTCASIERVYVADAVADEFQDQLLNKLGRVKYGGDNTEVGSLTFKGQLATVERHVDDAIEKGAQVLAGGPDPSRNVDGSLWYPATVLEGLTDDMDVVNEENFGPVLPIIRVRDDEEAVRRANEEGFNLTASVWTRDRKRGESIASRLRAGTITLNSHGDSPGAAWAPWGGVGKSGYGRLSGAAGLREFVQPIHIARPVMPGLKRLWWYPYDEATITSLRAGTDMLTSPSPADRARHLSTLLKNLGAAIRNKI